MSDKPSEPQPEMVRVEMAPETMQKLAELMPAVSLWAKTESGEGRTGPGDVIALAIGVLHAQVFARADEMIASGEVTPTPSAMH